MNNRRVRLRPVTLAGLFALSLVVDGCGGSVRSADKPVSAISSLSELRYRLAVNPRDRAARVRLGELYARTGRRRAALRELDTANKASSLQRRPRQLLAHLLLARARARVDAGVVGGAADLERALRLHPGLRPPPRLRAAAEAIEALALLNSSDEDRRKQGRARIARVLDIEADHPLAAVRTPAKASQAALASAIRWLHSRGARRLVLQLGNHYVRRGGRDAAVIVPWVHAYNWWHGASERPSLLLMRELVGAGVDVCDIARQPDDYGCGRQLNRIAASAERSWRLLRRARQLHWFTSDPDQAGPWTILSLRAWLFGEARSWLGELARRVDLDTVVAHPGQIPLYARATVLRAIGHDQPANLALLAALAGAARMTPPQRAVVLVEAAIQGKQAAAAKLLAASDFDDLGWRAALVVARVLRREAKVVARAPASAVQRYLLATGRLGPAAARAPSDRAAQLRLARWSRALRNAPLTRKQTLARWQPLGAGKSALPPATQLGGADLLASRATARMVRAGHGAALTRVAAAYAKDRAVADRLAQQFADAGLRVRPRAAALSQLFGQLGDATRALRWGNAVVAANPASWRHLVDGAVAAALADKPRLARLRFIDAASRAPDPGAVRLLAAQTFLRVGKPVDALIESRSALRHTAPGEAQAVLRVIIAASLKLGRTADAVRTARRWIADTPAAFRPAARAYLAGAWLRLTKQLGAPRRVFAAPGRQADPSDAITAPSQGTAALESARRWNPHDVIAATRLLAKLPATDSRRYALAGQLLARILVRMEQGRRVGNAVAGVLAISLEGLNAPAVAAALRRAYARYKRSAAIRWSWPGESARRTPGR